MLGQPTEQFKSVELANDAHTISAPKGYRPLHGRLTSFGLPRALGHLRILPDLAWTAQTRGLCVPGLALCSVDVRWGSRALAGFISGIERR